MLSGMLRPRSGGGLHGSRQVLAAGRGPGRPWVVLAMSDREAGTLSVCPSFVLGRLDGDSGVRRRLVLPSYHAVPGSGRCSVAVADFERPLEGGNWSV